MSQQWGTLTLDSGLCTPDHTPSSGQLWEVNSAIIPVFLKLGNGNPLQYSCLENPMDGGAWWATVYGVAKSWTQLSDLTFHLFFQLKTQNSEIFFFFKSHDSNPPAGQKESGLQSRSAWFQTTCS